MLNPFRNWIAGDAWELPEADVGDIGAQAFEACRRAIAATVAGQGTTAVLVRGEPGSGKTHLLRRLHAWLAGSADARLRETLFVYVRLATTARMVWRHLRRRIADDLMRPAADGSMQLELLLYRVLAAPGSRGPLLDRWKRDLSAGLPWDERSFAHALAAVLRHLPESELAGLDLFRQLEGEADLSPGLVQALRRLAARLDLLLVRAWLRGDSLTDADLALLGIAEDADQDSDPEDAAREIVLTLARLAGARMPMVLCFDQVEALETAPGDQSGFLAFGAVVSALHAETKNLALITCMQSSLEPMFRRADWDRIGEHQAHLPLLKRHDALRLLEARLDAQSQAWEPPAEFDTVFHPGGVASARAVLARAAELFDRGGRAEARAPLPVDRFLEQEWERRVAAAADAISEGDIDEVLDQGIQSLLATAARGKGRLGRGGRDVDFRFESAAGPIDVSLCNQRNMNSLAARLRRLGGGHRNGGARLVLVRDPRLPVSRTARATRGYLEELAANGARVVRPSIEALQALEALRSLLADARSGDLTRDGAPIAADTVQDWIVRNMPSSLAGLAEEVAGHAAAPPDPRLREDLLALVEERCVVDLEEAARETRHPAADLRLLVLASPGLAGFLEGPPPVLYRLVPTRD